MAKKSKKSTKRALLVGINNYGGVGDLSGCVNDVTNIRSVLKTYFGFENSGIRVLTDARATKENIEHRLKALVKASGPGDTLFFHYSGHGAQIRDRNGDEQLLDQMDELICPHDMDWDGTYITDDQLNKIFKPLDPKVHLEVVMDCCHAETLMRNNPDFDRPAELGPEHPTAYRRLIPPVDLQCRYEGQRDKLPLQRFKKFVESKSNRILWAACQDWQTSADAYMPEKDTYNGAFTYYFCDHIRRAEGRIGRDQLIDRVRTTLRYKHFDQIPQLEYDATGEKSIPGGMLTG